MKVLGIESTAHTFGIGLFDGKNILLDRRIQYKSSTGIIPRECFAFFCNEGWKLLKDLPEFTHIAVATGPGLGICLKFGIIIAKYLAKKYNVPITGVNHCVAHIEVGKFLTKCKDPVVVYVSGANTQIIIKSGKRYKIFGETLDIGLGNMLDMFAREVGIGFPGGPVKEKLAKEGKKIIELPYTVKGSDLVFSGLYTAAIKATKKYKIEDVCYSLQEVAFSMVCEVAERALAQTKREEVLLVGGVFANKRFVEMFKDMAKEYGAKIYICPQEYVGDNGVMIAITGYKQFKNNVIYPVKSNPYWRTDQVDIY